MKDKIPKIILIGISILIGYFLTKLLFSIGIGIIISRILFIVSLSTIAYLLLTGLRD